MTLTVSMSGHREYRGQGRRSRDPYRRYLYCPLDKPPIYGKIGVCQSAGGEEPPQASTVKSPPEGGALHNGLIARKTPLDKPLTRGK